MARTRRRDWIRYQGRANAALMLLARDMDAEFVEPADEKSFAAVRGRTDGCTFELHVVEGAGGAPVLALEVRHFHSHEQRDLDAEGCAVPNLDPAPLRAAIEHACRSFVESAT